MQILWLVERSEKEMIKEKFLYWIKNLIKNKRKCRRFCVKCEFYDICRAEGNESKDTSERDN